MDFFNKLNVGWSSEVVGLLYSISDNGAFKDDSKLILNLSSLGF
jgi:hypothetical protein